jgi:hypothetical protein
MRCHHCPGYPTCTIEYDDTCILKTPMKYERGTDPVPSLRRHLELLVVIAVTTLAVAILVMMTVIIFPRVAWSAPRSCIAEALAYAYGTGDRYGGGDWLLQCPTRTVLTPLLLPPPMVLPPPPPMVLPPPPQMRPAPPPPPLAAVPPPVARAPVLRHHAPGPRGARGQVPCPDGCPRDPD